MRRAIALATLLFSGVALACPPAAVCVKPVVVRQVVTQQAVVVAPVVATPVVALAVPLYSVSYSPPPPAPDNSALIAELKALREEVAKLRADTATAPAPAEKAPTKVDLVATLTKCAQCHSPGKVATDKGSGFELFKADGKTAELSLSEKKKIRELVSGGKMPPKSPLSDAEQKALLDYLDPKPE